MPSLPYTPAANLVPFSRLSDPMSTFAATEAHRLGPGFDYRCKASKCQTNAKTAALPYHCCTSENTSARFRLLGGTIHFRLTNTHFFSPLKASYNPFTSDGQHSSLQPCPSKDSHSHPTNKLLQPPNGVQSPQPSPLPPTHTQTHTHKHTYRTHARTPTHTHTHTVTGDCPKFIERLSIRFQVVDFLK